MSSTKTSWKTSFLARSTSWRKQRCFRSRCHTMMSFRLRTCGRNSRRMPSSRNTSLTNTQPAKDHLESISSISLTRFIPSISPRWWIMLTSNAWRLTVRIPRHSPLRSQSSGKRSWSRCPTYHVSKFLKFKFVKLFLPYRKKWKNTPFTQARIEEDHQW